MAHATEEIDFPAGADIDVTTAYRTLIDQTVELGEGTGIVHIAPAYGDLEVGPELVTAAQAAHGALREHGELLAELDLLQARARFGELTNGQLADTTDPDGPGGLRLIAVTTREDVGEWLEPDWIIPMRRARLASSAASREALSP